MTILSLKASTLLDPGVTLGINGYPFWFEGNYMGTPTLKKGNKGVV